VAEEKKPDTYVGTVSFLSYNIEKAIPEPIIVGDLSIDVYRTKDYIILSFVDVNTKEQLLGVSLGATSCGKLLRLIRKASKIERT